MDVPVEFARLREVAVVLLACTLSGCPREVVEDTLTGLARLEQVDFNYLVLEPDALGRYTLHLPDERFPAPAADERGLACFAYLFDQSELSAMLASKDWVVMRRAGSASSVTVNLPFTFEMIERCYPPRRANADLVTPEVIVANADLSVPVVDANGIETGRARPANFGVAHVEAKLSGDGEFEFRHVVKDVNLIGVTDSRTRAAGPMSLDTVEIGADLVGRTGTTFTRANTLNPYSEAAIKDVLANPRRFTGTFSFLAGQGADPATRVLLLAWDGDMVLRTDL